MHESTPAESPLQPKDAGGSPKQYTLLGPDGTPYRSPTPGTLGGHRRQKGYGRLDCRAALRWIAKGYYVKHRVFFADEATAIAAGYRPCAVCMPERYRSWKEARQAPPTDAGQLNTGWGEASGAGCSSVGQV